MSQHNQPHSSHATYQPPAQTVASLVNAQAAWRTAFEEGPYSAIGMLRFILQVGGKTLREFLADPKSIQGITKNHIAKLSLEQMAPVWREKSGRCTSFAVKVATKLEAEHPGMYSFRFYSLNGHRIARCPITEVTIDSSSATPGGAFQLPPDRWQKFPKSEASWKYVQHKEGFEEEVDSSKFSKTGDASQHVAKATKAITAQEAMVLCIEAVEKLVTVEKKAIPTLFRSVDEHWIPRYHCIITFHPRNRAIEMAENVEEWKKKHKTLIQWPRAPVHLSPTQEAAAKNQMYHCVQTLAAFIGEYGGPRQAEQFEADGISNFFLELFTEATTLWGYPQIVQHQ